MKLTLFVDEIQRVYKEQRQRYVQLCQQLDEINAKAAELRAERNKYSPAGFDEKKAVLDAKKSVILSQLEDIPDEFAAQSAAVRKKVKDEFSKKYGANPSALDNNAVALLNSGLLTADELKDLAESFSGNMTMLRLIGAAAERTGEADGDEQLASFGRGLILRSREQPHLDVIDGFISLASKGLRTSELEGRGVDHAAAEMPFEDTRPLADGYDATVHSGVYSKYAALAENYDSI